MVRYIFQFTFFTGLGARPIINDLSKAPLPNGTSGGNSECIPVCAANKQETQPEETVSCHQPYLNSLCNWLLTNSEETVSCLQPY